MTDHETTHPPVKDIGCQGTMLVTSCFSDKLSILTLTRPTALPLGSEGLPSAPDCHEAPDSALRPSPSLQSAGGLCLGHRTKAMPSVHLPSGPGPAGWADHASCVPETLPLGLCTCCALPLVMVSVLRSTCADGKMQKDGELCEGTGTSEKKGINIKSYSQGGVALELGSGDVALGRWEGGRRAF